MKYLKISLLFSLSLLSLPASAYHLSTDASIGGGLLGSDVDGRLRASFGSVASTATALGNPMSTKDDRDSNKDYPVAPYLDYEPKKHKEHKKNKECPPGLAMQDMLIDAEKPFTSYTSRDTKQVCESPQQFNSTTLIKLF